MNSLPSVTCASIDVQLIVKNQLLTTFVSTFNETELCPLVLSSVGIEAKH